MIIIKNPEQIALMRSAGHLLYDVLQYLASQVSPGITTEDINRMADEMIRKNGAIPTELGYAGYPKSICLSVDDEVVHGIPSPNVVLQEGQIISMDLTLSLNGWQSDSCLTVPVGEISRKKKELLRITEECFWKGWHQALSGNRIGDISAAVQKHAESHGFGVVRDLTGHGIGREMHEDPSVPNFGAPGHGPRLKPGMTICIVAELALVFVLSAAIRKLPEGIAYLLFIGYAALNGLTLSVVFIAYELALVQRVFFITAGMFGGMVLYGTFTKSDLSSIGAVCGMALWGLIIALLVNLFLKSSGLDWIVTIAGVVIFTGLTMYDAQKIRLIAANERSLDGTTLRKVGILGALELYLDFINLFLYLLRFFGRKR